MEHMNKTPDSVKIVSLRVKLVRIALLLAAVAFTLCSCYGAEGQEIAGGAELAFTTADSGATTVETIALSDLLVRSKADASETEATTETEAETAERLLTTEEPPETEPPETEPSETEPTATESSETEPPATEALSESAADADTESGSYILNTNTKKFHFPSCASVETIKPKNKSEYTGAREDLIAQGYSPCKRCNP